MHTLITIQKDGRTNSFAEFAGLDMCSDGTAIVRFGLYADRGNEPFTQIAFHTASTSNGTTDALIAEAHQMMRDLLAGYITEIDAAQAAYHKRTT